MKVCFITPELPPYLTGGIGVATLNLAKVLAKRGHDITIITRQLKSKKIFEKIGKIKIYRLKCTKLRFLALSHFIFIIKTILLIKTRKINCEVYYAQAILSQGFTSAILNKYFNKKTVVHIRGIDFIRRHNKQFKALSSFVLKNNTLVFTLSKDHQKVLTKEVGRKIHYLTNGKELSFKKSQKECKSELKFGKQLHITYVGRLDTVKGLIYAIKAIENIPNTLLHIIGEESSGSTVETERLKKYVKDHKIENKVIFHGVLNRNKVFTFIKASDIFIHPLLIAAGMGNAVLEAMYLKTVIIGTNIGYFKELISDNKTGLLVKKSDANDLRKAIIKLGNVKKRRTLEKNAFNKIVKDHSWENIAKKFEKVMKDEFNI